MNKSVFSKGVSEGLDGCANAGTLICRMPGEGNFFFLCSIILYGARLLIGVWADFEPTHLKLFIFLKLRRRGRHSGENWGLPQLI